MSGSLPQHGTGGMASDGAAPREARPEPGQRPFLGAPGGLAVGGLAVGGLAVGGPVVGGPTAIELLAADDGSPAVLDDSGRFARVLHGRVRVGAQSLLDVAIKVQRDGYLAGDLDDTVANNEVLDEAWRREIEDHRRARAPQIVELLLAATAAESPPVLHCRRQDTYFHPPCPRSGQLLRVCRDERLLHDSGLHAYKSTLHRYLVGGAAVDGSARVFYKRNALDDERPRADVVVRSGDELLADLALIARSQTPTQAWFPCQTCPERDRCFPADGSAGAATQHLVVVSYYDFAYLVLPALPLTFDAACELAGGASWADVEQRHATARASSPATLGARLLTGRQRLAAADDHRAFALEVLRTKLSLLHDVATGVAALQSICGRAHLGIEPRNVMAELTASRDLDPALWGLRARLLDLGAARRFVPAHASRRDVPVRLVPDANRDYRNPAARAGDGATCVAHVLVERSADPEIKTVTLQVRFPSDFDARDYQRGDLVRVMLTPDVWVWAELEALREHTATLLVAAPRAPATTMLGARREFQAHLWLQRGIGAECDLHGLGMLLFRAMLANDETPASRVLDVVARIVERLDAEVDERQLTPQACRQFLARKLRDHGEMFRESALAWGKPDRAQPVFGMPSDLWHDMLMFGFRLVSSAPGFGLAGRVTPEATSTTLAQVVAELRTLQLRAHTELFDRATRDRELTALCRDLLGKVRDDLLAEGLRRLDAKADPAP